MNIDTPTLMNWITAALIATVFGALSALVAHYFQRQRDDVAWNREKEKMQRQTNNDLEKLHEEIRQELYKQRELVVRSEILPTLWKNLLNAISKVSVVTSAYRRDPDLNIWTDEAIRDFLKNSPLSDTHKKQLLEATDKTSFYRRTIYWYELDDARKDFGEFHNHWLYNKFYLGDELRARISEIDKYFSDWFIAVGVHHDYPAGTQRDLNQIDRSFHEKADLLMKEIEKLIQQDINS